MIKRVHVSANTSQQQKNRQSNTKIHVGPLSESKGIVRPLFLVAACKRANEGVHWSRSKGAKCSINKSFYGGAWKRPWTKAKQHFRLSAFARPFVSFKVSRMQTSFGHCFKLTSSRIPKLLQWVLCLGKRTKNFLSEPSLIALPYFGRALVLRKKCPFSGARKWDFGCPNPKTETNFSRQHPPKMME